MIKLLVLNEFESKTEIEKYWATSEKSLGGIDFWPFVKLYLILTEKSQDLLLQSVEM